jgi:hypothetical protein
VNEKGIARRRLGLLIRRGRAAPKMKKASRKDAKLQEREEIERSRFLGKYLFENL